MKNRARDYEDLLPPLEFPSEGTDDDVKIAAEAERRAEAMETWPASMTSREFLERSRETMEASRYTQTALNNNLMARISRPTSDYNRSHSSISSDAEEERSHMSCFSSVSGMGRVSPSSLRRELMRRTSLVGESRIVDDPLETACEDRLEAARRKSFSSAPSSSARSTQSRSPVSHRSNSMVHSRTMKDDSITRLRRQLHRSMSSPSKANEIDESIKFGRPNRVTLHIYDLIAKDTLVQFPSPLNCVCEIGKCFNDVNSALHELGTGAYHVGVEVNGIEYAYGATSTPGKTGIFSCIPKLSPGYQYRTSIDFGDVTLKRTSWVTVPPPPNCESPRSSIPSASSFRHIEELVDGRKIIKEMTVEYMGSDYDILRKNCCSFAHDACVRLGVPKEQIPSWFSNLAQTGAYSQDLANATLEPIHRVLSIGCGEDSVIETRDGVWEERSEETGFEIIARRNATNTGDVVVVIDADPNRPAHHHRTRSAWAY